MEGLTPRTIKPSAYRHTKSGKQYEVIEVALHAETHEQLVIYRPLYESKYSLFARPYDMFTELVVINGETVPRFAKE